jgi:hypothetical protein
VKSFLLPSSFEAVRRNLRQEASHSARRPASCRRSDAWTIEDEQCQKIGGGYEALKFRFLAVSLNGANFLSTPIQSPIVMKPERNGPPRARNVEERRFTAPQGVQRGRLKMSPAVARTAKRGFWIKAQAMCSILTGLWILGILHLGM